MGRSGDRIDRREFGTAPTTVRSLASAAGLADIMTCV
jgi:hypothetical protein